MTGGGEQRKASVKREVRTLGEVLFWSYANLAMAHKAVVDGDGRYGPVHYAIRARLYAGLCNGSMNVASLVDDERLKMVLPAHCAYCGATGRLSVDHVFARARGGADELDNTVWACRSCNSSKGKEDLLAWYAACGLEPPLLLLRRYLKQCIAFAREHEFMDVAVPDLPVIPFAVSVLPEWFPDPLKRKLWVVSLEGP